MHDIILAKQIFDKIKDIKEENKLEKISKINIELGRVKLAHDFHPEHEEDISEQRLKENLSDISKGTDFEGADFDIKKIDADYWRIVDVEGE